MLDLFIYKVSEELIEDILVAQLHTVFVRAGVDRTATEVAQQIAAAQTPGTQERKRTLDHRLSMLESALEICRRHAPFTSPFDYKDDAAQKVHDGQRLAELERTRHPRDDLSGDDCTSDAEGDFSDSDDDYLPDASDDDSASDSDCEEDGDSEEDGGSEDGCYCDIDKL